MNYEPWTIPHDADRPGLRDYLPRPAVRRRRSWTLWLIAIAFVLGFLAGATVVRASDGAKPSPVVSLIVRPQIMLQRGDIRAEIRIPHHADNRILAIAWTSDHGTEGSTQRALEGDDAPVLHELLLRSQPPANYLFIASVFSAGGRLRGRADARIAVPDDGSPLGAQQTGYAGVLAGLRMGAPAARRGSLSETRIR